LRGELLFINPSCYLAFQGKINLREQSHTLPLKVSKMTKLNQILDEDEILVTFSTIDDVIKAMGVQGDKQQKMGESEVLTVAFISHRYFGGNYKATLSFLSSANQSLFNNLLSNFYQKAVS